jgi:hypothetical protein
MRISDRDNGYARLMVNVRKLSRGRTINVGVTDSPHAGSGLPTSTIGAIHEFGLGHVPQRSFLRGWVDENEQGWFASLKERVYRALLGDGAYADGFGQYAVDGVRARMRLGIGPALLEATIKRKQNGTTPLIETEQLINGIEYDVAEGA